MLAGKLVIRGTRLSVGFILNLRAHGAPEEEILNEYPGLAMEDIQACYLFAGKALFDCPEAPIQASLFLSHVFKDGMKIPLGLPIHAAIPDQSRLVMIHIL